MDEPRDTANPSAKPPPEPQRSVHAEPEEPADGGTPEPGQEEDSRAGRERD
jgi:hypothetical protein